MTGRDWKAAGLAWVFGIFFLEACATPGRVPKQDPEVTRALFARWEKISLPSAGAVRSIGQYSAGCLDGAIELPPSGRGYVLMHPERRRGFGHPALIRFLKDYGERLEKAGLPRVLVGDLGQPRGGPMRTGHMSHQVGLDVDLWYRTAGPALGDAELGKLDATSYVSDGGTLSPRWSETEDHLLELALQDDSVERIFVNPVIKRHFCETKPGAAWLHRLRPWWGHAEHFHIRLRCPPGEKDCQSQPALDPSQSQCGSELDWWFSAEARETGERQDREFTERPFPELPAACEALVR